VENHQRFLILGDGFPVRVGLGNVAEQVQLAINFAGQDWEMCGERALVGGGDQEGEGVRLDESQSCGTVLDAVEFGDVQVSSGSKPRGLKPHISFLSPLTRR
jgi:hypothetical protein